MKKTFFAFLFTFYSCITLASHITGGEMIYEYLGPGTGANTRTYRITLKLFRDQTTTGAPMPTTVFIGIFDNDNNNQFPAFDQSYIIPIDNESQVNVNPYPPCVINASSLDYHVGSYSLTVELPNNQNGYTASYQTCCRVNPLNNVFTANGVGITGSTYSCLIPPFADTSPAFASSIDLICYNRDFVLKFNATDIDGDSLVYSFVDADDGGLARNANNINPSPPPYAPVSYINNFLGTSPLGKDAVINSSTGVISGIAPAAGKYVVCVRVKSYKKGKYVGEHKKDFIVNVGDCDFAGAQLDPKGVACDGFEVGFSNDNNSPLNKTFYWDFGDPKSGALNISTDANAVHKFSDTGVYMYKLVVNRGLPCSDSITQTIRVYPGFFPGFISAGQCKNTPIQFTDTTKTRYGKVNSWSWDFGDLQTLDDTSHSQKPSYKFSSEGDYAVTLSVTNTKGCAKAVTINVSVENKADLGITNDTLICSIDTLQLNVVGTGTFTWTPNYNINNPNIASPLVSPDRPTRYYANFLDPYGCTGSDSVFVDVKDFVTLNAGNDTSICMTDAITLNPVTDALQFKWLPPNSLNNDAIKNPVATPLSTTTYSVTGLIGKCQSTDDVIIKVTPYPLANAGSDSSICFGNSIQLKASGGTFYKWSPAFFLNNPDIPDPIANPISDMNYAVTVSDTLGCPKPVKDSVTIRVLRIIADAGPADTSVVVDQPLQLNATGGEFYIWKPALGLNNTNVNNPIARLSNSQQYVVTANQSGCFDTDTINVTVYKIAPGLYVPNAFTPDNNGTNDVFRPIPIGMKRLSYFRVYNRLGTLVFSTSETGKGWDGTYKGKAQDADVYVWMAEGIDYSDKKITRKGSVVLIR